MRVFQYQTIVIGSMDPDQTRKDRKSDLHHVHFNLSSRPSSAWSNDFNQTWYQHIFMSKRHAQVDGDRIVVTCMLEELSDGLKAELDKIVGEVNKRQQSEAENLFDNKLQDEKAEREDKRKVAEAAKHFNQK